MNPAFLWSLNLACYLNLYLPGCNSFSSNKCFLFFFTGWTSTVVNIANPQNWRIKKQVKSKRMEKDTLYKHNWIWCSYTNKRQSRLHKRNNQGFSIRRNGLIHQNDITILSMNASNNCRMHLLQKVGSKV